MGFMSAALGRNRDPFWDLEGKGVRRRRRLRRLQAVFAWIDLAAVLVLALAGPTAFRIHDLF